MDSKTGRLHGFGFACLLSTIAIGSAGCFAEASAEGSVEDVRLELRVDADERAAEPSAREVATAHEVAATQEVEVKRAVVPLGGDLMTPGNE